MEIWKMGKKKKNKQRHSHSHTMPMQKWCFYFFLFFANSTNCVRVRVCVCVWVAMWKNSFEFILLRNTLHQYRCSAVDAIVVVVIVTIRPGKHHEIKVLKPKKHFCGVVAVYERNTGRIINYKLLLYYSLISVCARMQARIEDRQRISVWLQTF